MAAGDDHWIVGYGSPYVLRLAEALRDLGAEAPEIFALAALLGRRGTAFPTGNEQPSEERPFQNSGTTFPSAPSRPPPRCSQAAEIL
jgi:hypothetical protein